MADLRWNSVALSPHSELNDEALCWLAAEAGPEPPFSAVSHTRASFRRAKLRSSFFTAFIVTGVLLVGGISYAIYVLVTSPTWSDAGAKLHNAPLLVALLVSAHLVTWTVAFVVTGGLGGSALNRPKARLTLHATARDLTIADDAGRSTTRPWSHWRIGAVGTISTGADAGPNALVASLTLVPFDDDGRAMGSFDITLSRLLRGDKACGRLITTMLAHATPSA